MRSYHVVSRLIATATLSGCAAFNNPGEGTVAGAVLGASAGTAAAAVSGGSLANGAAWGGGIGAGIGLGSGLSNAAEQNGWFETDYTEEIEENHERLRANNQRIERERRRLRAKEAQFPEPW